MYDDHPHLRGIADDDVNDEVVVMLFVFANEASNTSGSRQINSPEG